MRKYLLFILLIQLCAIEAKAQLPAEANRSFVYQHQWSGGGILHTRGLGFTIERGKYKTAKRVHFYSLDFINMEHPKEVKQQRFTPDAKRYKYGKINSLFVIRPSFGISQRLYRKKREQAVQIDFKAAFGPSLGLLKPIYLEVIKPPSSATISEPYDPSIHNNSNIYGKSSGYKGISEMAIKPGGHFRSAFVFEYDPEDDGIQALEIGAAVDVFGERLSIMVDDVEGDEFKNDFMFTTLYLRIIFGRKFL